MSDGKVVYEVRADDSKVGKDLDEANKTVKKHSEKLAKTAKTAAVGIGTALAASGVAAIKFGSDFEQTFADTSTLIDTSKVDMNNLKNSILDLSTESGIAATELNQGLYSALSAGVPITEDATEAMKFMEDATKLAKAGFTDVDTAISATAKTLNAYGMDISEAERIQGILIQTQNKGITTVGELGAVLSNVTPTAAAANVSFEEVGAALATMTAQGTPAAQATTQLNSAISAFLKPNKEMVAGLRNVVGELIDQGKITGDNAWLFKDYEKKIAEARKELVMLDQNSENYADETKRLKDLIGEFEDGLDAATAEMGLQVVESEGLQGSLELLNEQFDGSTNKMAGALGSSEALKASLAITGENAAVFTDNLASMNGTAGLVDEAFNKVSDTTKEKFAKNINELKNILIEVFLELQNVINKVFEFVEAVKAGETWVKLLAVAIGTVTALIIAYNIQQALATSGLTIWAAIATGATAVTTALGAAFAFLTSPIGLVILAVGAIIAAGILLVEHWEEVKAFLIEAWTIISETAVEVWTVLKDFFIDLFTIIRDFFVEVWTAIKDFVVSTVTKIGDSLKQGFKDAINFVTDRVKRFRDTVNEVFENVKKVFNGIVDFIKNVFTGNWSEAWEGVKNVFASVFDGLKSLAVTPINWVIRKINSFLSGLNNIKIPDWMPGVGGKGFDFNPIPEIALAKGGLAFGPTTALVGDNPNAMNDPEVIAPLSKLRSMMSEFSPFVAGNTNQNMFNFNLTGRVEVDGVELGEIMLNNVDEARQFL